jgi:signal peptidase I
VIPLVILLALAAMMAMTVWVAIDAARRQRDPYGWAALVATTNIVGLAVWLVRRRSSRATRPIGIARALGLAAVTLPMLILPLVLVLVLAAIGLPLSGSRVARVEGQAMAPTLNHQDRLLVDRLVYRRRAPQRGDLVMLRYPLDPERSFLKRVIAIEGDDLRIVGGYVLVNGVAQEEPFVAGTARSRDDWGPKVVPAGQYFVMGDRRNNSSDSRHWGYVPRDLIVGRVYARWWPPSAARRF